MVISSFTSLVYFLSFLYTSLRSYVIGLNSCARSASSVRTDGQSLHNQNVSAHQIFLGFCSRTPSSNVAVSNVAVYIIEDTICCTMIIISRDGIYRTAINLLNITAYVLVIYDHVPTRNV